MPAEKSLLRNALREKLSVPNPEFRARASQSIAARVTQLASWQAARTIGLFFGRTDEMDTSVFWEDRFSIGKTFLYPKIEGAEIAFYPVRQLETLQAARWDLREPVGGEKSIPELILVPGLGFDRRGGRLGRGKGFYDLWLARNPFVRTIGVAFDRQIVDEIPRETHDIAMQQVVTETTLFPTK